MKTINGQAHERHWKRPPSDLELMLYLDGELEEPRLRDVREAIERDKRLQKKLAALALVSEVVEENAISTAQIDLADAIMAKVATEDVRALDPRDLAPQPKLAERAPAEVKPLLAKTAAPSKVGVSNDNGRGIFSLAALAVAAAAGLMIWGRMDTGMLRPDAAPIAMLNTPEAVLSAALPTPAVAPTEAAPAVEQEGDDGVGVEVAAVNFGSRIGTIFYVPTEAATSNHTTTVVWLSDDSAGGEQ